ncbi:hypothetical protein MJO29_012171 [Puccinia striiformis f. sp. tritici]|uniref:Superoxide dismutase copper/zinc binding domain-containing protein n=2 Tax=Puccinia striiformis TaxID=27350 RepID=A0A0L0VD14_9BASI|nr:hypothetical protein Pst134EA_022861 [Puccinia striiformis f. sp. tritici]KAI9606002.1 hypothetical protein H4Q26_004374 [Puccinia striiformis f. sp. tritici PST-130]KNE97170.1 hypothetical protein PSTG_09596 [Puccinia striiformis f. sp. tritici PST-78]POW22154.1 hypothetical protein PSHT_01680 [Puccinia striiformis]KAH9445894.1 hypothetical protein Pst134EB_023728 [Puccinia striiformis f. sp. tritici]KAH9455391.1 hypothetical protein Pst134EA_022861 [Puccinia striiformis f. sp. tritici]
MSTKLCLLMIVAFALTLSPTLAQNPPPKKTQHVYPHAVVAKIDNGQGVLISVEFTKVLQDQRPPEASHFNPNRPLTSVTVKSTGLEAGKEFNYFIHEKAITGTDCSTAGGHWNPKKWDTTSANYRCNPRKPSRCEAGDLSGKHGMLKGNGPAEASPVIYYDTSLRLAYSGTGILGKSVVVSDPTDHKPVACGNIIDPTTQATS